MVTIQEILEIRTKEGNLYKRLDEGRLRCVACGHRCPIPDGHLGVCKVRFNKGGNLLFLGVMLGVCNVTL